MVMSIVVPVYNTEKYLDNCIESVLIQTGGNWELILVDDGSTDESGRICDEYAEKYPEKIKVFHNENHGQFFSRTYGIKQCSGDYIGFLDADDFLCERYFEKIADCIQKNGELDLICFAFCRWKDRVTQTYSIECDNEISVFEGNDIKLVFEQIIDGRISGSMCSKVFKKEILANCQVSEEAESRRNGEDAYQSFSAMKNVRSVALIKECLYFYRENEDGYSLGFEKRDLDYFNMRYVFEVLYNNLYSWNMADNEHIRKLLAHNFNGTVNHILKYYRSAENLKRKIAIINHDWTDYLLKPFDEEFENNPYLRESYVKVWKAFCKRQYLMIFIRENFRKIIGW